MNRKQPGWRGRFIPSLLLSNQKGSSYYDLIIKTFIVLTLLTTVLSFLSIFTTYINLNHVCRRVVREIELEGQVSNTVYEVFTRMKEQTGLNPEMQMEGVDYFEAQSQKIQLRQTFTVVMKYNHVFTIFAPSFAPPMRITIPMQVRIGGMSERYWKTSE